MKGIVFTKLFDMIEESYGFEVVEQLITNPLLSTGGAYTSVGTYQCSELITILEDLHKITGTPIDELLEVYGFYLFPSLMTLLPKMRHRFTNTFELMSSVDSIIHVQVKNFMLMLSYLYLKL